MKKQVYYHDTDCGGVVYYANYLKYFEEARTEYFSQKGLLIKELADSGTMFVVARQEVDYKAPGVYGDVLEVKAGVSEIGAAKIVFDQETTNQKGVLLNKGRTVLVCVGRDLKPKAIPDAMRAKLE